MNKSTFEQELATHGILVYKIQGSSMLPLLRERRDLAVIEPKGAERCKKYDVALYRRKSGNYVLHRILKVRESDYVLCGDRCTDREEGIVDAQICGVLKAVLRGGKRKELKGLLYWIYLRLWCDLFWLRVLVLKSGALLHRIARRFK